MCLGCIYERSIKVDQNCKLIQHSKVGYNGFTSIEKVYFAFRKTSVCGLELVVHVEIDDDVGHAESLFDHLGQVSITLSYNHNSGKARSFYKKWKFCSHFVKRFRLWNNGWNKVIPMSLSLECSCPVRMAPALTAASSSPSSSLPTSSLKKFLKNNNFQFFLVSQH